MLREGERTWAFGYWVPKTSFNAQECPVRGKQTIEKQFSRANSGTFNWKEQTLNRLCQTSEYVWRVDSKRKRILWNGIKT